MNQDRRYCPLPTPCIIESGIVVNKDDIKRLINDLTNVRYIHRLDGKIQNEGEGWILEVFDDPSQSTIVVNNSLYINIQSFDYLQISQSSDRQTHFHLIQDNRELTLIPLKNSVQQQQQEQDLDAIALEEMLSEVLSAKWDVQLDEDF
jgi:hypothetical protein